MIRAVLVGWSDGDWRLYRQPQWMAEVRRFPQAATLPRRHFDVDEDAILALLDAWSREGAGTSLSAAIDHLGRSGAIEVLPP